MQRSRTPALGTDTSGINESNSVHTGEASDSGLDYSNTPLLHHAVSRDTRSPDTRSRPIQNTELNSRTSARPMTDSNVSIVVQDLNVSVKLS